MAAFVAAGLLGFLGSGPISRRSVTTVDGALQVDYERFLRSGTRTTLLVRLRPADPDAATFTLRLAQAYLEGMRVERVFPPPRRVQVGRDHVVLDFEVDSRPPGPRAVTIHLLPAGFGGWAATVGLDAGPELRFHQWIYP
jgi:hypothetical protein